MSAIWTPGRDSSASLIEEPAWSRLLGGEPGPGREQPRPQDGLLLLYPGHVPTASAAGTVALAAETHVAPA